MKATEVLQGLRVGHTGSITIEAIEWLNDADVRLVQIEADARISVGFDGFALGNAEVDSARVISPSRRESRAHITMGGRVHAKEDKPRTVRVCRFWRVVQGN